MLSSNSSKQPSTEMWVDRALGGLVDFFASMRLTVVCLVFGIILVLIGTLGQVEIGLYRAQQEVFRSFFIFWGPAGASWKVPVFPGGYLVGGVLLLNLLASFLDKSLMARRGVGIWFIHLGLILLLLGQLLTDMLSVESAMQLAEGEMKNYSEDFRAVELAVTDLSDPKSDKVYAIPARLLAGGKPVKVGGLPFEVNVRKYWKNVGLVRAGTEEARRNNAIPSGATAGELKDVLVIPQEEASSMDERNTPGAVVEITNGSQTAGIFLVSPLALTPQQFTFDGRPYQLTMRFTRHYYPFSVTLLKATHEKYKGTDIPKNFASRVRVNNQATGETRETVIKMNSPLRYGGQTFYQYQMAAGEMAASQGMKPSSTFQVVRNPGWLTPYLSTALVSVGLLVQFGTHLLRFVRRKSKKV